MYLEVLTCGIIFLDLHKLFWLKSKLTFPGSLNATWVCGNLGSKHQNRPVGGAPAAAVGLSGPLRLVLLSPVLLVLLQMIPLDSFVGQSADGKMVPIIPGGGSIPLSFSNRKEYVERAVEYRLHEIDRQVNGVRRAQNWNRNHSLTCPSSSRPPGCGGA